MLKNLQNYSDGARMLVDSYLNGRTQFGRCGEKKSSVGRVTCGVPQRSVLGPLLFVSYRQEVVFKACLRYIHMRRRLDHVSYLESTVTGTLLVDNDNARIKLLSFL
jgi:hypothetical protein